MPRLVSFPPQCRVSPAYAALGVAMLFVCCRAPAAVESGMRRFDLPRDTADKSLKRFAQQSGLEIIFSAQVARDVITRDVHGEMTPDAALRALLAGTGLEAVQEPKTGAVSVRKRATDKPRKSAGVAPPLDERGQRQHMDGEAGDARAQPFPASTMTPKTPTKTTRLLRAVAGLLFGALAADAQTAAGGPHEGVGFGTVSGKVLNEATKDYLTGASVRLEGTSYSTVTVETGDFSLRAPAGDYVAVIDYTGLKQARMPVVVRAGEISRMTVPLSADIYLLEAVTVKGLREGQAAAIQSQRNAMNVKNSAAIDAFGDPSTGVGELIQRLPGISADMTGNGEVGRVYIRGMSQDFSSLMLDGNQVATSGGTALNNLNVHFGQWNTGSVSSLEVIKAPTPDMDANAISGFINIRTKRAFERAGRDVSVTAGTTWTMNHVDSSVPYKDRPQVDLFNVSYTDVFSVLGGTHNLGVTANVGFFAMGDSNTGAGVSEVGPQQALGTGGNTAVVVRAPTATNPNPEPLLRGWGAGQAGSQAHWTPQKNASIGVDYKVNDDTVLYFKYTFAGARPAKDSAPAYFRWRLAGGTSLASFTPDSTSDHIKLTNATATSETLGYSLYTESHTFNAGLERQFFERTGKLEIDASYSSGKRVYFPHHSFTASVSGVQAEMDFRGRDMFNPLVRQIGGPSWSDPANYRLAATGIQNHYTAPAERRGLRADFRKDLNLRFPAYIKTGVKWAQAHQTLDLKPRSYRFVDPALLAVGGLKDWMPFSIVEGEGAYGPIPFLEVPGSGREKDVYTKFSTQSVTDVYNTTLSHYNTYGDFYQDVYALYGMGHMRLGRLRILAGLRMEETRNKGSDYVVLPATATNTANESLSAQENVARAMSRVSDYRTRRSDYRNVFPGLHLVYDLTSSTQVRFSYNTSISRPQPNLLMGAIRPNFDAQTLSAGNPDLKPYTSDNFEFMVERYFEPVGRVSVGVFLKEIKDYYRTFSGLTVGEGPDNGFDGNYAGFLLTQNRNVGSARIRGVELDYSQQFSFLPGFLRGFGVAANYTYLETWGDFGGLIAGDRLNGFTPHTANGSISYRGRGLQVRLLTNYRSDTLYRSGNGAYGSGAGALIVPAGSITFDQYNAARQTWDLKTEYTINRSYSLFFDVYNLFDEPLTTYYLKNIFGHDYPYTQVIPGTKFTLGVKGRY